MRAPCTPQERDGNPPPRSRAAARTRDSVQTEPVTGSGRAATADSKGLLQEPPAPGTWSRPGGDSEAAQPGTPGSSRGVAAGTGRDGTGPRSPRAPAAARPARPWRERAGTAARGPAARRRRDPLNSRSPSAPAWVPASPAVPLNPLRPLSAR